ncbi:MAG: glycosyltransferase family 39 protein [Candidatus Sumerlaeota bacterium]|nr:glycosyltransferase family 39 protein [Candidatus Sumerlaeota bacterium]
MKRQGPFELDKISEKRLIAVLVVLAVARVASLGAYPLMDTTEGRYAEIGRQILSTGHWVMPDLAPGLPFWGKPPLSFWLTAISFKCLGVSEFTARFPSFLLSIFVVWLTGLTAGRLYGRRVGFYSAIILATTGLFQGVAGGVMTDPALAACLMLSMTGFAFAAFDLPTGRPRLWGYVFFVGLGLSLLAKGPIGAVLALLAVFLWTAWRREWKKVWRKLPWITGAVLMLAISVPWYVLADRETPGFLRYFLLEEHWRRFLDPGWRSLYGSSHECPRGTIWLYLLAGGLPWSLVFGLALGPLRRRGFRARDAWRDPKIAYGVCWILAPLLFFTMARNIMITYVLSAMPPLAILTAAAIRTVAAGATEGARPRLCSAVSLGAAVAAAPLVFLLAAFLVLPRAAKYYSQKGTAEHLFSLDPGGTAEIMYFSKMPYSAEFYMRGRPENIARGSFQELQEELNDNDLGYFVVPEKDEKEFTRIAKQKAVFVAKAGNYVIYQQVQTPPAK